MSGEHRGPATEERRLAPRVSLALALLVLVAGLLLHQQLAGMDPMLFRDVRGLGFYLVGAYGPAARAYRQHPAVDPPASPAHAAAERALAGEQPRDALDVLGRILASAPDDADALALAAVAHAQTGETDVAIDRLSRLLRRTSFPRDEVSLHVLEVAGVLRNRPAAERPSCLLAELYRYLRVLDPANGRLAEKAAHEAIRRGDRPADAYLVLGVIAEKEERVSEALAAYQEATRVDPRYADGYRRQAIIHGWRGDLASQYRTIRAAFELAPADRLYVSDLQFVVLNRLRDVPAAVQLMRRAVATDPRSPVARRGLGWAYGLLGRWEESTAEYREAIRLAPSDIEGWQGLAWILKIRDDVPGAISAYLDVLRRAPADRDAWEALGALYARAERHQDAIRAYAAALTLGSQKISTHEFLCVELFKAGVFDRATQCLDSVLQRDPNNLTARTYRVWSARNAALRPTTP